VNLTLIPPRCALGWILDRKYGAPAGLEPLRISASTSFPNGWSIRSDH
jgi:hypothetical protein